MRAFFTWFRWMLFFLLASLFGFFLGDSHYFQGRLPPDYFVESLPVGELGPQSVLVKLRETPLQKRITRPYYLTYGKKRYPFWPWEIGGGPLYEETVKKAFRDAERIPYLAHLARRLTGRRRVISLNWEIGQSGIRHFLEHFQKKVNARVIEAKFYVDPKGLTRIRPDVPGRTLLLELSAQAIYQGLYRGMTVIPLAVTLTPPKVTAAQLKRIPHPARLSSFTTYYGTHDSPNRIHNIHLIASWVDNTWLEPEEVFSLLAKTGHFTPEEGYREAFVIVGDMLVPQYGGGACQIATTLYNAVQLADLAVLSRGNHNIYFSIYPLGRDATIYPPSRDFKFRNDTGHPIIIYAIPTRRSLTFQVFGEQQNKTVSFTSPQLVRHMKTIKERKKVGEKEAVLETGETTKESVYEEVVKKVPTKTFSVVVERVVKENGKVMERETIQSRYIAHGDRDVVKKARPEPR